MWHPLSSLPVPGGSEGPSRSLSSRLVIGGTRLLSWHRGHIKGLSSWAPRPKQVPALGTHPRACPSRSRSSCWHQPGHILAFESLISWEKSRLGGCSPSQCPKPGVPAMYSGACGDRDFYRPPAPWGSGCRPAIEGLLGLREVPFYQGCSRGQACIRLKPLRLRPQPFTFIPVPVWTLLQQKQRAFPAEGAVRLRLSLPAHS